MAPLPDSVSSTPDPRRPRRAGTVAAFVFFATAGAAALAAAALAPEYADLLDLQSRRDALAHQVDCAARLAVYYDRLDEALRTDRVTAARMLIRHANYRPLGYEQIPTDVPASPSAPARLRAQAGSPPPPRNDRLAQVGRWLAHGPTRACVAVLGLGMVACGVILFGVSFRPPPATGRRVSAAATAAS